MSVLNPDVRMIELVDGDLQPKRFAPDRGVRVVEDQRFESGPTWNSGRGEDAVLDGVAVSVDDDDRDFDVPRRSLTSSLEISLFDRQVKVVSEK